MSLIKRRVSNRAMSLERAGHLQSTKCFVGLLRVRRNLSKMSWEMFKRGDDDDDDDDDDDYDYDYDEVTSN